MGALALSANCSVLHRGLGMHGDGRSTNIAAKTPQACCEGMAAQGAAAFTFHSTGPSCVLSWAPLGPHVSPGTADAVSGCATACPATPPPPAPFPGPVPPSLPNATVPEAPAVMPPTPTFKRPPRPNIVLFFGDDVGYGDLGCFGNPTSSTPALDAMAAQGARLQQYLSAASICSPSRGGLMTGRNFVRIGIYPGVLSPNSVGGLPLNETTVASKLKKAGYRTGMVGRPASPSHHRGSPRASVRQMASGDQGVPPHAPRLRRLLWGPYDAE